jgi:hypothetical protein
MKENQEILDIFGSYVGHDAFDGSYGSIIEILNGTCPNKLMKNYIELFNKFSGEEKEIVKKYMNDLIANCLFDFLRIFEEHPEFKIIYEKDGQKVDLNEISEMLKAEPIIEGGWIERFSQELKKEKES